MSFTERTVFVPDVDAAQYLHSRLEMTMDIGLIDDPQILVNELPVGWRETSWIPIMTTFRNRFPDFCVTHMRIVSGLLRFEGEGHPDQYFIFDSLVQGIARASAIVCMQCGKFGKRRKTEFGKPCLCHFDYIHYVNALDTLGML